MNLSAIVATAANKQNFTTIENYIEFCKTYLDFIEEGLQAVIIKAQSVGRCLLLRYSPQYAGR